MRGFRGRIRIRGVLCECGFLRGRGFREGVFIWRDCAASDWVYRGDGHNRTRQYLFPRFPRGFAHRNACSVLKAYHRASRLLPQAL